MTNRTNTPKLLDNPPVPLQVKLAAAWTSFMFLYVYVDILGFYKPGVIDDILAGIVFEFEINETFGVVGIASVAIPALMIWLSMTLPARANRITNLVVATLYIPFSAYNVVGESSWLYFYALSIGIELLLLAFILRSAWTWPRTSTVPGGRATADLRQDLRQ